MPALMAASVLVQGTTNHDCAQGVSSRPNSVACRPRNQRKKLTMEHNSTQFALPPQHDGGIQACVLDRTRIFAARIRRKACATASATQLRLRKAWSATAVDSARNSA